VPGDVVQFDLESDDFLLRWSLPRQKIPFDNAIRIGLGFSSLQLQINLPRTCDVALDASRFYSTPRRPLGRGGGLFSLAVRRVTPCGHVVFAPASSG
jgi:hypothetical protein